MVKFLCIIEVEGTTTVAGAQRKLDAFREATLPAQDWGLTIMRARVGELGLHDTGAMGIVASADIKFGQR